MKLSWSTLYAMQKLPNVFVCSLICELSPCNTRVEDVAVGATRRDLSPLSFATVPVLTACGELAAGCGRSCELAEVAAAVGPATAEFGEGKKEVVLLVAACAAAGSSKTETSYKSPHALTPAAASVATMGSDAVSFASSLLPVSISMAPAAANSNRNNSSHNQTLLN